jgi:hypothetical protein
VYAYIGSRERVVDIESQDQASIGICPKLEPIAQCFRVKSGEVRDSTVLYHLMPDATSPAPVAKKPPKTKKDDTSI